MTYLQRFKKLSKEDNMLIYSSPIEKGLFTINKDNKWQINFGRFKGQVLNDIFSKDPDNVLDGLIDTLETQEDINIRTRYNLYLIFRELTLLAKNDILV